MSPDAIELIFQLSHCRGERAYVLVRMFNFAIIVLPFLSSLLCHHILANEFDDHNCTNTNCVHIRRAWPKLNFDFYHGQGDKVEYSIETTTIKTIYTTRRINSIEATPSSLRNDTTLSSSVPQITTNCSDNNQLLHLESYLLRTVLNMSDVNGTTKSLPTNDLTIDQMKTFFQNKLQLIYQLGVNRLTKHLKSQQKRHRRATTNNIEVMVKDVVTHNTSNLVNVIYFLRKNNLLVPYHDAEKIISFVDRKHFAHMIEFEVIELLQRKF